MQNIIHNLHNKYFIRGVCEKVCIEIVACITNNPDAYGISRCKDLNIKCEVLSHKDFRVREDFDRELTKLILSYSPDLTVLAGFMRVLSLIFTSKIKAINIHPSLLPKYKGANGIRDTYDSGDEFGGVTVHWVNEGIDDGEIILQESIFRLEAESFISFETRIHQLEYILYPKAILKALDLRSEESNG
ncbi:phosphoribosylglycinamide formyltransferase [Helicobacter sp. 13S00477-4]|nr:phosphoribosylglycinamide formyltransferase [Helicobacter sp. 13S00477-4]